VSSLGSVLGSRRQTALAEGCRRKPTPPLAKCSKYIGGQLWTAEIPAGGAGGQWFDAHTGFIATAACS
jgi:hypothetical protein